MTTRYEVLCMLSPMGSVFSGVVSAQNMMANELSSRLSITKIQHLVVELYLCWTINNCDCLAFLWQGLPGYAGIQLDKTAHSFHIAEPLIPLLRCNTQALNVLDCHVNQVV
ncbi:hypothetical protein CPB85DRAFT_880646 [Mucidula mucida]|nr:hypothetical protein CPB85DRAFT_880646 [Mucidula mucida]